VQKCNEQLTFGKWKVRKAALSWCSIPDLALQNSQIRIFGLTARLYAVDVYSITTIMCDRCSLWHYCYVVYDIIQCKYGWFGSEEYMEGKKEKCNETVCKVMRGQYRYAVICNFSICFWHCHRCQRETIGNCQFSVVRVKLRSMYWATLRKQSLSIWEGYFRF
jgi:hypothetical protein